MTGIVVIFSIDLIKIPCCFPAKGEGKPLTLSTKVGDNHVDVCLFSEQSPAITNAEGTGRHFFYNKASISITKKNEDLANSDFIEGRARYLLKEFQSAVIDVLNRLVMFFKYEKRHPNLRQLSVLDLLSQDHQFCNPAWKTLDGKDIIVSEKPIGSGVISIPNIGLLGGDIFGIIPFTDNNIDELQKWFSSEEHDISLSADVLSDAQSAALSNNIRRAVLELAISIEVYVKSAFFKQERIAGAAFEYLEDKGRQSVRQFPEIEIPLHAKIMCPNNDRGPADV